MNISNILLCILVLLVVPTCAGYAVCRFCRLRRSVAACYLGGTFAEWAMLQCLSVPMTLLRWGFVPLTWVMCLGMVALGALGARGFLEDRRAKRGVRAAKGWRRDEVFALLLLTVGYLYLAYNCAIHMHIDYDDSRFVVTAVDIVHTNRLFLTDYGTGAALSDILGTFRHDLFSPWPVYVAFVARVTGTHATIIAHSVLPQTLMLCALSAWLLVGERHFTGRRFEKYSVALIALLLIMYGRFNGYTAEGFFLLRLWQGKAVVASIGIPVLYLALTRVGKAPEGWRPYLPIYITALAMCLMSAMGIILCSMLCGIFGLAYGIQMRKPTLALKIWGGALICVFFVGIMLMRLI